MTPWLLMEAIEARDPDKAEIKRAQRKGRRAALKWQAERNKQQAAE